MRRISSSQFNREFIGRKKITEPLILTYYDEPIAYIYPADTQMVAGFSRVEGTEGPVTVYKAEGKKDTEVDKKFATHTGQCQVCFEFGPIKYGQVIGEHGGAMRWLCQKCYEKGEKDTTGFGPKDMTSLRKSHTFRG